MTTIRRTDRSLTTLRKILREKSGAQSTADTSRSTGILPNNKRDRAEHLGRLEERLRGRLTGLDISLPDQQERAVSLFLETVLAYEFGSHLLQDPSFQQMLHDVRQGMLEHSATRDDLLQLLNGFTGSD